ncbi:uncharacterized protein BDZ99DRAFT_459694 [Mytilinidion resinicola]|uniref:Isochorismatase hydrolase n=1 Tax=Mytilinidion resinicola TaxID=574789 RepID=A0A6A6YYE1_9PEZI|nr:uncharacterized protein BDZ99DRAFT_459694 [Mytilinidion resinicola]KAF2813942.1 hypothetical protein BDZ99DRAFT_459694 [Mytilinidion resinicola]
MAPKSFRKHLGIPPSTASPSDSALIIIDAQNEYAKGLFKFTNAAASGAIIASLLKKYRDANSKIVFTPGTELAEAFEEVKAKDGKEVIWKDLLG